MKIVFLSMFAFISFALSAGAHSIELEVNYPDGEVKTYRAKYDESVVVDLKSKVWECLINKIDKSEQVEHAHLLCFAGKKENYGMVLNLTCIKSLSDRELLLSRADMQLGEPGKGKSGSMIDLSFRCRGTGGLGK